MKLCIIGKLKLLTKNKTAKELNIPIISEEQFVELIK